MNIQQIQIKMCIYCVSCHICADYKQYEKPENNPLEDCVIFSVEHDNEDCEVFCTKCDNYLCEYHFSLTKEEYPINHYGGGDAYVKHCFCCTKIEPVSDSE